MSRLLLSAMVLGIACWFGAAVVGAAERMATAIEQAHGR